MHEQEEIDARSLSAQPVTAIDEQIRIPIALEYRDNRAIDPAEITLRYVGRITVVMMIAWFVMVAVRSFGDGAGFPGDLILAAIIQSASRKSLMSGVTSVLLLDRWITTLTALIGILACIMLLRVRASDRRLFIFATLALLIAAVIKLGLLFVVASPVRNTSLRGLEQLALLQLVHIPLPLLALLIISRRQVAVAMRLQATEVGPLVSSTTLTILLGFGSILGLSRIYLLWDGLVLRNGSTWFWVHVYGAAGAVGFIAFALTNILLCLCAIVMGVAFIARMGNHPSADGLLKYQAKFGIILSLICIGLLVVLLVNTRTNGSFPTLLLLAQITSLIFDCVLLAKLRNSNASASPVV